MLGAFPSAISRRTSCYGKKQRCLIPHTRDHWASAIATMKPNGSLQITVWDSAAAPCTARDYKRIFALCGINNIKVRRHAIQPRASNECGLHVLLWAYRLLALTTRPEDINKPAVKGLFSLRKWRQLFQRHHNLGTEPKNSELIATIPGTQVWLSPITKEAKGDICCGARPKCPGCHGQLTRTGDCLSAVCPAPYAGLPLDVPLTRKTSRKVLCGCVAGANR